MSFESMPRQDLLLAIDSLAQEKMIDRETVVESLEAAIAKIAKHKYGEEFNIVAEIDRKNGAIHVKRLFDVIESPENMGEDYDANKMLTVQQAKKYSKNPVVGDVVEDALPEPEFGRMAFQTARQIMTARVRDAEKGHQYEEFKEFQNTVNTDQNKNADVIDNIETQKTPDELIAEAKSILTSHLESDLLAKILDNSPAFFEELVAKLLLSMGYGGSEKDILQNRGKSGDEGIDGIIKQDVLGLDKIYIQAKRWNGNVSRPEVQKFVGAVHGQNANRGVFITTSTFTNEAKEYAKNINSNIILIDGKMLTKLMIEYNVGVQIKDTIQIKKIDEDFFIED